MAPSACNKDPNKVTTAQPIDSRNRQVTFSARPRNFGPCSFCPKINAWWPWSNKVEGCKWQIVVASCHKEHHQCCLSSMPQAYHETNVWGHCCRPPELTALNFCRSAFFSFFSIRFLYWRWACSRPSKYHKLAAVHHILFINIATQFKTLPFIS